MSMKIYLVFVIGCLSVANAQNPFCSGGLCFIRPDPNSGKSWMAAQQICKDNNSTLPITDNPNSRMSIVDALSHLGLNGMDVWLGANASDRGPDSWRWLDGSQYSGIDVQERGEYYKSYAYVAKTIAGVLAYASPPNVSYAFVCQCRAVNPDGCTNVSGRTAFIKESGCFMRYDEKLSWFNARNKCLANGCDLASVSQLFLLGELVDSSGFWVGLRTCQWNWQNAVTGLSSDVTFTSWKIGQPNDATPDCMAADSSDFPNWRDADCSAVFPYICQVSDKSSSGTAPNPSITTPTIPTSLGSTPTSTSTTISILGTPRTGSTSASLSTPLSSNTTEPSGSASNNENGRNSTSAGSSKASLAIGLCVGLGVPVIIAVTVIAVVLRRKHQNRQLGRNGANFEGGESKIANSKQISTSSSSSALPPVGSAASDDHYQQLKNSHELQEQQQYEELQAPQYEQLQRHNELQEQQQYEQLPQTPQYEQL